MEQNRIRRIAPNRKNGPTLEELYEGVISQNRGLLARAITLIESNAEHHHQDAQTLLHKILPHTGNSIRIGISGVPGAGKSTFIEAFGLHLCELGHRVAVLAVDPSSSISGGSILGDKTRMEELSRNPYAFIRPSPTGGKLGGVHRKTRETLLLCEAAGFDVILVETVGVGQSEVAIRGMVDFFMLLALTGAGDELQGMKKGIMEIADSIVVNKADGANKARSIQTALEYNRILHFLQPATEGWRTRAFTCSSIEKEGISDIWNVVKRFSELGKESGIFFNRRKSQSKEWVHSLIADHLHFRFFHHPEVKQLLPGVELGVMEGELTAATGVEQLIQVFLSGEK